MLIRLKVAGRKVLVMVHSDIIVKIRTWMNTSILMSAQFQIKLELVMDDAMRALKYTILPHATGTGEIAANKLVTRDMLTLIAETQPIHMIVKILM